MKRAHGANLDRASLRSIPVNIGIALGGGGARGLAHFGVLKALEEEGIPVHYITGASMGAIVGAMYAQNPNADFLTERLKQPLDEDFYHQFGFDYLRPNLAQNCSFLHQTTKTLKKLIVIALAQRQESLLKDFHLRSVLSKFIDEGNIEDTKIPLVIVATSLRTGEDIVFRSGDIIDAVVASSSIPCFLSPICLNGDLLIDGAVSCPFPVKYLREVGADVIIGVEVCMRKYQPLEAVNVIGIIDRVDTILSMNLARMMVNTADVAIFPDTKDIYWSDFSRTDELIEAGLRATKEKIPQIKEAVRRRLPWYKRVRLRKEFIERNGGTHEDLSG